MTETVDAVTDVASLADAVRPQPLGAFPLPLGYMLIPTASDGNDTEEARTALLAGRIPDAWPPSLRAHELAFHGDRDGALAALEGIGAVDRYNRFVLDPDQEDPAELRCVLGEFAPLVDLVQFVLGRSDVPPEVAGSDGELAAVLLAAKASHALATDDPSAAIILLDAGVDAASPVSPPLAGLLLGAAGSTCVDVGEPSAAQRLEGALRLLDGADGLRIGRAELHLTLAGLLHEQAQENPGVMAQAIPHYHAALQLVLRDEAPLLWASAHANLAAAYLVMPMVEASGQLRLGVAAQSLRSALTVYTRDDYPEQWASVQLNLANSLVYTPSKHQADNLVEAVELYEAVLDARDRTTDPLGRARVLANQGNVLAHLGMFEQAKAKLYEARSLFEELADEESVRAVRGVLDEVARQVTLNRTGAAQLNGKRR